MVFVSSAMPSNLPRVDESSGDVVTLPPFDHPSTTSRYPVDLSKPRRALSSVPEDEIDYAPPPAPPPAAAHHRPMIFAGQSPRGATGIPFVRQVDVDVDSNSRRGSRTGSRRLNGFDLIIGYRSRSEKLFWRGCVCPPLWVLGASYLLPFRGQKADVEVRIGPDAREIKGGPEGAKDGTEPAGGLPRSYSFSQSFGQAIPGARSKSYFAGGDDARVRVIKITRDEYRKEERDWATRSLVAFLMFLGVVGAVVAVVLTMTSKSGVRNGPPPMPIGGSS